MHIEERNESIPKEQRRSLVSITAVWTGFVLVAPSMLAGGAIGPGLRLADVVWVTLLGNGLLSLLACFTVILAARRGASFPLLARGAFGPQGSRIVTLFIPLVNVGWYAIQSALVGVFIAGLLNVSGAAEAAMMITAGLVMATTAYFGYRGLSWFSYLAVPAIVILVVLALIRVVETAGFPGWYSEPSSDAALSVWTALAIVIGTWIFSSVTVIADIMRFARRPRDACIATIIGLMFGNSLLIIAGAITVRSVGTGDLSAALATLGLAVPATILLIANIWTTNDNNIYSTSLSLSNTTGWKRSTCVVIAALVASLATLTHPEGQAGLIRWLLFLGSIVPPLAGTMLVHWYIVANTRSRAGFGKPWNWRAFTAWGIGVAFALMLPVGFPPLTGLAAGAGSYFLLSLTFERAQPLPLDRGISEESSADSV